MKQSVRDFVDKVAGEVGQTVPEITVSVVTGHAAQELINTSRDADMLVVGSRGGGGSPGFSWDRSACRSQTTRNAP
jgi:nucleotide-binding universal stress UspA family protein